MTESTKPLTIQVYAQTSAVASAPSVTLQVPAGCKIISGGAQVSAGTGAGNMLIASFPKSATTWFAQSKDTAGKPDRRTITAYAVTILDPDDLYDVKITSATSAVASHPTATATVAADYMLTGGGAMTSAAAAGQGNFLTASYPLGDVQWLAASKDHINANPSSIVAYAIGITAMDSRLPPFTMCPAASASASHPSVTAPVSGTSVVLGGGGIDAWKGAGNMLVASYPACTLQPGGPVQHCSTPTGWTVAGQDYATADPSVISAYVIELNTSL
jgi:hypothetical protein